MRRKMGMILMIIGVLCFLVGFIFYSSSPNKPTGSSKIASNPDSAALLTTDADSSSTSQRAPQRIHSTNELDKIIDMAIADGVLTPNERNLIKDFAYSRGLNFNVIMRDVEKRISESGSMAETEMVDVNKKVGDDFENFIVQKFDRNFFKIKEWAGDKYVNGVYAATTQQPDLLVEFKFRDQKAEFSVECKWRNDFYKGGIEFATPEQLKRYQKYANQKKTPVYIAIGVGGKGESPENLFIVPLNEIESNFIPAKTLYKYKKSLDKNFYFDTETQRLK